MISNIKIFMFNLQFNFSIFNRNILFWFTEPATTRKCWQHPDLSNEFINFKRICDSLTTTNAKFMSKGK